MKTARKTASRKKSNRWYDRMPALAKQLDKLRDTPPRRRDRRIREILLLVKEASPNLLDRFVLLFPLNILRRRWYDNDPYLWLVFNGLRFADNALLTAVARYLKSQAVKRV